MAWTKRLLEYGLVVLVAFIVALALIWLMFPRDTACTNCVVSMPQVRAECDKQFYGSTVRARQLEAGAEDEFLLAYVEGAALAGAGGGYSSPTGYSSPGGYSSATTPSATVAPRGPGYVIVRAQPQIGYDYSGGQSPGYSTYDTTGTRPDTVWEEVTVTVARYVNPLRNDALCQASVRFRDGKFEQYCEVPTAFGPDDAGQQSIRVFVRNESSVPVEYCIVSNCDASAPYGQGTICQGEQAQALQ